MIPVLTGKRFGMVARCGDVRGPSSRGREERSANQRYDLVAGGKSTCWIHLTMFAGDYPANVSG